LVNPGPAISDCIADERTFCGLDRLRWRASGPPATGWLASLPKRRSVYRLAADFEPGIALPARHQPSGCGRYRIGTAPFPVMARLDGRFAVLGFLLEDLDDLFDGAALGFGQELEHESDRYDRQDREGHH